MQRLSPKSQAIRILISDQMIQGYNQNEIAKKLGRKPSWISSQLDQIRAELLLQQNLFFPLADHEYDSLRASIKRNGIRSPIIIGEHIPLIDGRHRLLIAQELGITDAPAIITDGLTPEQEREIAISLNTARRQLTNQQKRVIVEAELMRDPTRSDRLIASIAGLTHPTVGQIRTQLAQAQRLLEEDTEVETPTTRGEITTEPRLITNADLISAGPVHHPPHPPIDTRLRVGRDGIPQQRPTPPPQPQPDNGQDHPIGHANCAHGQRHAIHKDGAGYRLEGQ